MASVGGTALPPATAAASVRAARALLAHEALPQAHAAAVPASLTERIADAIAAPLTLGVPEIQRLGHAALAAQLSLLHSLGETLKSTTASLLLTAGGSGRQLEAEAGAVLRVSAAMHAAAVVCMDDVDTDLLNPQFQLWEHWGNAASATLKASILCLVAVSSRVLHLSCLADYLCLPALLSRNSTELAWQGRSLASLSPRCSFCCSNR